MAQPSSQHLKKRGGRWYLKLAIPRKLRYLYRSSTGKKRSHIEEALGTHDLLVANRMKHERIAHWVREFTAKERGATGALTSDAIEAHRHREGIRNANSDQEREAEESLARDTANEMRDAGAVERAEQFHSLATAKETLREGWDNWKAEWATTQASRYKYEQAFRELLEFLGAADAVPATITNTRARAYVRYLNTDARSARGDALSKATKEGRLSPLRTFWAEYLLPHELAEGNPWLNHKLTEGNTARAKKRPYTDDEILALLKGPERVTRKDVRYEKRTILELYALAFYTGARREEIASRLLGDVEKIPGGYVLHIRDAKTEAGERSIPIHHPIPVAVLERRIGKRTDARAQLFEEFKPGGPDKTLGEHVGKSMGHYRKAAGVGEGADFHSTRRQLITRLVAKGHSKELVQFYVGHKVPGVTGIYARATDEGMRKIARSINYPANIERAFKAALQI